MNLAEIETFLTIVNTRSITRQQIFCFCPSLQSAIVSLPLKTSWDFLL